MPDEARHRVRLRDVAARAGVSVGSASQAFSRPELVSDEVRTRVLEAAASFYARLLRADVEEALVAAAADIDALT